MRNVLLAISLTTLLLLGACANAPKSAPVPLAIETGTWDVTSEITQGRRTLPQHVVDRMTPENRKEYEEMLRKLESSPNVQTHPNCVTAKDLEAGVFNGDLRRHGLKCKVVVKVGTATHQEVDRVCEGSPYVSHITMDAESRESVRLKAVLPNPDIDLVVEMTAKWMRASCSE